MTTKDTDTHSPTPAAEPLALRLSEGLGPLPEAEWLAGDGSQAWRAATVLSWPTLNAKRYTVPLFTADQLRAAFAAGRLAERNRCRYPQCVENEDERCPRWLTGECEGPNVADKRPVLGSA